MITCRALEETDFRLYPSKLWNSPLLYLGCFSYVFAFSPPEHFLAFFESCLINKVTNSFTYWSATKQCSSQKPPCSWRWCVLTHAYRGNSWKHLQNTKHDPLFSCCRLFLALFAGKSTNLVVACLSFPLRRGCHSEISADSEEAAVWAAHCQGGDPSMGPKIGWAPKRRCLFFSFCTQVYEHFLSNAEHFFLFFFFFILPPCTRLIWTDAPPALLTIFDTHLSSASPISLHPHLLC